MNSRVDVFNHTLELSQIWIAELDSEIGWDNPSRTYKLWRAVMHALRDRLSLAEAADLAAQMPLLLRGAYFDGWRPAATRVPDRSLESFLEDVSTAFQPDPVKTLDPFIPKVFGQLDKRISQGEMEQVRHALPASIRQLWPRP